MPTLPAIVVVIGEIFQRHAEENFAVITFNRFLAWAADTRREPSVQAVALGQGLRVDQRIELTSIAKNLGLKVLDAAEGLAPARHTHKRHPSNVALFGPRSRDDGLDEYAVVIDPNNEALLDHVTSQHISAAVGIEVVRQACIDAYERRIFPETPGAKGFIYKLATFRFSSYVFPLPATVTVALLPTRRGFKAQVVLYQSDRAAWTADVEMAAIEIELQAKLETKAAEGAIERFLECAARGVESEGHQ